MAMWLADVAAQARTVAASDVPLDRPAIFDQSNTGQIWSNNGQIMVKYWPILPDVPPDRHCLSSDIGRRVEGGCSLFPVDLRIRSVITDSVSHH
jgi:hypothetical protein